ncbi:DUF418 domain-containing protein [Kineococcus gynurae]|uniref:DUF418 domain-containing protein n=1 Tax=Kineococcus gynurae TaxID=452979 RepID=A0ABV5LRM9_9ACTN
MAPTDRLRALDLARGVAILGTLATNVWIFTDPEGLLGYVAGSAGVHDGGWAKVQALAQQLAQGKFLALLTLLFGIGLELQRRSAARHGRRWPGRYWVRALVLFVDGLVNYVLVAEFDVLMGYAVTAVIVAAILATSDRAQRVWIGVAVTVHLFLLSVMALVLALLPADELTGPPLDPNPYADGSFWDLARFRLENAVIFRGEPVFILALGIALFLIGARLARAGLLDPDDARGRRLRRRLLVLGGPALVLDLTLGLFGGSGGLVLARYGTAPFVALGLLAAIVEFCARIRTPGRVGRGLAAVGRTALSCYLVQNLLAGAVCYGWGLGLAARVPVDQRAPFTLALLLGIWVVLLLGASLWVRRFERGPLETVSHRLTRPREPRSNRSGQDPTAAASTSPSP